jgi:predicted nuclease of restriction endonuclease-like (RecB) superfamily
VARWRRTHHVIVVKIATRAVSDHLRKAKTPTSTSPHACRRPLTVDERSAGYPLVAPVNQWGHAPFPLSPMTPHAVSRQARDLMNGLITNHRDLDTVSDSEPTPSMQHPVVVGTGYTKQQVRAAWDQRRSDLSDLAGVADELADVDRRAAEINHRIDELMQMVIAPWPAIPDRPRRGGFDNEPVADLLPEGLRRAAGPGEEHVLSARLRGDAAGEHELIDLNWRIGRLILDRQRTQPWGSAVIRRLALDLRRELPDMTGLSATNLQYIHGAFATAWSTEPISPRLWGNCPGTSGPCSTSLTTGPCGTGTPNGMRSTAGPGRFSSTILLLACTAGSARHRATSWTISTRWRRPGAGVIKDPYVFDFLDLAEWSRERAIETALTERLQDTLAELGPGLRSVLLTASGGHLRLPALRWGGRTHPLTVESQMINAPAG